MLHWHKSAPVPRSAKFLKNCAIIMSEAWRDHGNMVGRPGTVRSQVGIDVSSVLVFGPVSEFYLPPSGTMGLRTPWSCWRQIAS